MVPDDNPLTAIEKRLDTLTERIGAIENHLSGEKPLLAVPSHTSFSEQLRDRLVHQERQGGLEGIIAYAGVIQAEAGELLWDDERTVTDLASLDVEPLAQVLAALGHPIRLELVRLLLPGAKSSQALQELLGITSTGPLYYHLKELIAVGVVSQPGRNLYQIAPSKIVPFLTMLTAAADVRN